MGQARVLSIGNFDGVHVGHQAILHEARAVAHRRGCPLRVLTFDPPPASVIRPDAVPPAVASVARRVELLREHGTDEVRVLSPTADLLKLSPRQFVESIAQEHHPAVFVEGHDFRFGAKRAGDVNTLAAIGQTMGFETIVVRRVGVTLSDLWHPDVSSSLVRWLVGRGRVADAAICLGRPFELSGRIVEGERRGRTIDVPTVNLDPASYQKNIVPADGVYAGLCRFDAAEDDDADTNAGETYAAAISVGVKPTFGRRQLTVEAHLLDFAEDVYGRTMTLRFSRWLRDQMPFAGLDALRKQLAHDVETTRGLHRRGELSTVPPIAAAVDAVSRNPTE